MSEKSFWKKNQGKKVQKIISDLAEAWGVEQRHVQCLFNAYYDLGEKSSPSFPEDRENPPAEDEAAAIAAGVMHPVENLSHNEVLKRLKKLHGETDRAALGPTFIAGLLRGRNDLKSPLASYACFAGYHFDHEFEGVTSYARQFLCMHCWMKENPQFDYDQENLLRINMLNAGSRPDVEYAIADLSEFAKHGPAAPTKEEENNFRRLLDAIRKLPEKSRTGDLIKASTGLIQGDKYVRIKALEILGWCGILKPAVIEWSPGVYFRPDREIEELGIRDNREWKAPTSAWCGADGVNEEAVAYWFPGYEGKSKPQTGQVDKTLQKAREKKAKEEKAKTKKPKPAAPYRSNRWPKVGEVYAVPLENAMYGACRIINAFEEADPTGFMLGPCFYVMVTKWFGEEPPADMKDPRLKEVLKIDHHSNKGDLQYSCVQLPPPRNFPLAGNLQPTAAEKKLRLQAFDNWTMARQMFLQWRWENEREQVLAEDTAGPRSNHKKEHEKRLAAFQRRVEKSKQQGFAKYARKKHFADWQSVTPPEAIADLRQCLGDLLAQLQALPEDAPTRDKTAPLRRFVKQVLELHQAHDYFLYSPQRDDLADLIRELGYMAGLDWKGKELMRVNMNLFDTLRTADSQALGAGASITVR